MNVRKLPDSLIEIEVRTHENTWRANGSRCQHYALDWSNDELAFGRARLLINKMRLHFTNLIAAANEPIDFCIAIDVCAERDSVGQPLYEAAHLPIVRTSNTAATTLTALVCVIRQVLVWNIVVSASKHELPGRGVVLVVPYNR
jgi:hypothetical protein